MIPLYCAHSKPKALEYHICIFLNYVSIDLNNIFVYHIFDSYCLVSMFLLLLISFCSATESDHVADVFMYV